VVQWIELIVQLKFEQIGGSDIVLIKMDSYSDQRGEVSEVYNQQQFHQYGICDDFVHEAENRSKFNVIRGLHYQAKENQISKLIRVLNGSYKCVFIDIRQSSQELGRVYCHYLADQKEMVYLPVGYAIGIQSFDHTNHFIYKMSGAYDHQYARSINPVKDTQALADSNGNSLSSIFAQGVREKLAELQNEFMTSSPYRLDWDDPTKWIDPLVSDKDKEAPAWGQYLERPEY